ncbi:MULTISPECIES: SDR family oxidoreductase [unclassified Crossiella]|uniref:SDR family oxidoreductase n=1 Tax=unclassified Crossiella TaxID=2620835 RepID=UPI001FFE9C0B|nr:MULTISPECIES: SDR family oxidoreductase [unclassified Crossiella]MCK2239297.1 SDR family oxidoreductase [Crossiella sp. S99.2]MCK2251133.1 SDR family oxidoreductase [Crossiella sp. S99.1]
MDSRDDRYITGAPAPISVVTGAGSGVGRAVARELLAAGHRVALAGRRAEALTDTAADAPPESVLVLPTDVTVPDSVDALFAAVRERWGRVDVLFNNAGVNAPATPLAEFALDQWQRVLDTNLTGAFLCAQAAFRLMRDQDPRGGRIINNGSISAQVPRPNAIAYNASKHAITGLTKSISLEGRAFGIACGQIDIGNAATELTERMKAGVLQADGSVAPEPTMDVTHVAEAVRYMAGLPLAANVQFMTVMATTMPLIGRG